MNESHLVNVIKTYLEEWDLRYVPMPAKVGDEAILSSGCEASSSVSEKTMGLFLDRDPLAEPPELCPSATDVWAVGARVAVSTSVPPSATDVWAVGARVAVSTSVPPSATDSWAAEAGGTDKTAGSISDTVCSCDVTGVGPLVLSLILFWASLIAAFAFCL